MAHVFITPEWFFGYDIALEFVFAAVTLLVAFNAWRIHKATEERNIKLFSMAFFFISMSYFIQCALNFIILDRLEDRVTDLVGLQSIYHLNLFGLYVHAMLFLIGILLLAYIALKIYSLRTFILLFLLVLTSLYFSPYKTFMLYLLSTVLLGFIVYYYISNYWKNRKTTALLVLIAMVLLFTSYLTFMFAMDNPIYYVMAHILELFAYLLVLINLLIIIRVGGKQRQRYKNGKKTR